MTSIQNSSKVHLQSIFTSYKMLFRLATTIVFGIVGSSVAALSVPSNLGCHDPSRIINDNGSYYFYCTSNDLTGWYTSNGGSTWKQTPKIFPNGIPARVHAACPTNDGHNIWAPDVIWNPNTRLFYVYYSVADWYNGERSAIGLVTSPTLNPSTAKWTDRGVVIAKTPTANKYNAIDPGPFFDNSGKMWMTFGSGYASTRDTAINVIALDKNTGLRADSTTSVIQSCGCEASYIQPHNGYYYLFWNTGGCCSGSSSTYTIHVARSASVTGPYSGTRTFYSSTSNIHGPGQIGVLTEGGKDYYSYHYYPNSGDSVLGFGTVKWGSDGWPSK
jgi:beta-xylosidase